MVEKVVLEYLRMNRGNYNLNDLKQKILSAGYSQQDIDDALSVLKTQSAGNVPSVPATINRINKTNIPMSPQKNSIEDEYVGESENPKKSRKWMWILIIVGLLLVLGIAGFLIWLFMIK